MASAAYLAFAAFLLQMPNWLLLFHNGEIATDSVLSASKPSYVQNTTEVFDFIIVGGGPAGALIANRLSKKPGTSVLLLERGGTPPYPTSIPSLWLTLTTDDGPNGIVKRYNTTANPGFSLQTGGVTRCVGPHVLGGGSTLNSVLYIRGSDAYYDEWAGIVGDSAWSADATRPFFKKHEDYRGAYQPVNTDIHGIGGEVRVEESYQINPSSTTFFKALEELGIPEHDLSGPAQGTGFQRSDINTKHGRRAGAYESFLEPILGKRLNLSIYKFATATKILFDKSNKATGVTYTRHGKTRVATARKEVILTGGAFESARLLMLSGIGPKDDLTALGIPLLADLPVGKNLIDHPQATLQVNFSQANNAFVPTRDFNEETVADYFVDGTGPMKNIVSTMGYWSSSLNTDPNYPDVQFFITHEPYPSAIPPATPVDLNVISVYVNKPRSAPGYVKLQSTNPTDPLIINPNFFSSQEDVQIMQDGITYLLSIYEQTNAFAAVGGAHLNDAAFPAFCTSLGYRSTAYWNCMFRLIASAGHHFVGTNKMGKGVNDPTAVVDSKLRVLKTTNLRVADASVMPKVPNANTLASTLMVAEKASDYIARRWGLITYLDVVCDSTLTGLATLMADPLSCLSYYQCDNGKWVKRACPLLTNFNAETGACDWPGFANCLLGGIL